MKKFLPIILLLLGVGVFIGVFLFIRGKPQEEIVVENEKGLRDIPLDERPIASLTPSSDGYWLKLVIEKIVNEADTMDYELLYKLPDGRTQGVPGTISLEGLEEIERDLLLGSESSGKFRYDEGVENGTLTLRFRDEKGKLIAKFSTDFHLQSNTRALSTVDAAFTYTLTKTPTGVFFVAMETFGVPGSVNSISSGPYGIFSSGSTTLSGSIQLDSGTIYRWTGSKWKEVVNGNSSDIGIFYTAIGQ